MYRRVLFIGAFLIHFSSYAFAQEAWTLKDSIKQALEVSPSIRSAHAEISAQKGELSQAGAWPNPSIELNANDKLGLQDNSGGIDLTEMSFNQPIPLGRLSRQKKESNARLKAAEANLFHQQLLQEAQAAQSFHTLQMMTAKLRLAEEQLKIVKDYQAEADNSSKRINTGLVRFLTPLEKKRLNIILANAEQELATSEGEYSEAVSNFKTLLHLSDNDAYEVIELETVKSPETLDVLLKQQERSHPAIITLDYQQKAAEAGIVVARGEIFSDPTLSFFSERDFIHDKRRKFYGMAVNFELPLWDQKKGSIAKAKSEAEKLKYDLQAVKMELRSKVNKNYMHLNHLIEQIEHYKNQVLVPAQEVFDLTIKSFEVGEVDVLALVDANNVYFDSKKHYLELIYGAWLELAELRLSAGLSLVDNKHLTDRGGKL